MKIKNWYKRPFLLLFLFTLISTPVGFWIATPKAKVDKFFAELPQIIETNILAKYPDDLKINVEKGKVTINRELPYCFVVSEENGVKSGVVFDKNPEVAVLIQKENKYSNLCKAVVLVGENYVVFPSDSGGRLQEISSEMNLVIDKSSLNDFVNKYLPIAKKWGLVAYKVAPFILALVTMLFMMSINIWYGWVLKVISKIFKFGEMSFSQYYKTTLVVFTIWSAFSWLVSLIIKLTMNRVVSLSPFIFFDTILITVASLYLIKMGKIEFVKRESR